ncbi:selenide, water dikinase SelD [Acanthopleuribacter pedis]|uniref:Selenide, water dikinase SelD n=2 Tax=Acanthopleuribacter pedis TaxID=442870 RepID=A0A8J7QIB5_9BACT|nr:selenide, water dikinase SelD [Acanthopleuribacter pedis]
MRPGIDERLLVGYQDRDDGAVYQLDTETALVQTVDFFTPIVDDPVDFGAIAAANALSDVYAMGGQPLTALSLVMYPYKTWPLELLQQIVAGGTEKIAESGCLVVGGHSVGDEEIKFGYAITGRVAPDQVWRNQGARAGDALVLTKPLGTGLLATAVKRDLLPATALEDALVSMKRLNRDAAACAKKFPIHAATDITGYGLLGHLVEMLAGSGLGARVRVDAIPRFAAVDEAVAVGAKTGAARTNRAFVVEHGLIEDAVLEKHAPVLFDPQTSGGLLFALCADAAEDLVRDCRKKEIDAAVIGTVSSSPGIGCLA